MTYCSIDDAKDIIVTIDFESTEDDNEILKCIQRADGLINGILDAKEITHPTSPYPQLIKDASAHFAAYFYRAKREPLRAKEGDVPVLHTMAMEFLNTWINSYYKDQLLGRGST